MAPSTKKLNERKVTKYIKQNPYSRGWCCNCHCTGVRPNYRQNINVDELIWKLLNIQKHNQVTRRTWPLSRRRMPRERNVHYRNLSLSPYERDSISRVSSESGTPSLENLTEPTDVSSGCSATPNFANDDFTHSYVENIGPQCSIDTNRALLNKSSIVEIINNYIKAGIEEGKRQAKMYIRKALRFGVKSGYLIPADPQGQVLKISPTLANPRQIETQLRKKKRYTRRVNGDGLELVQRKIRKNTLSRNVQNSDESTNRKPKRKDLKPKRQGVRKNEEKSKRNNSDKDLTDDNKKIIKKDKSKNDDRPKKQIKTGRVEKRGRKKQRRGRKRSPRKKRSNSKSFEKENLQNELDILNDKNNLENKEKCQNVEEEDEVKDDSSELIGCSFSKHRTQLLANQENETRNDDDNDDDDDDEEGEKYENNEDQVDDSVLKRNEG
ncbi:RNA polymerase II subunit 5-mediating protein homolog [Polistes fuscatus]|uniref:RNA polymerase II subunit 5-mediating protein homolog n=1 Tax=Polistes fuscatus TaxID=30207 RepID=UPI001CA81750|nr:RNA polymerase II subunit 5-mediating protein homolog [Polistes fuscatus]